jgi:hypothetical protein
MTGEELALMELLADRDRCGDARVANREPR